MAKSSSNLFIAVGVGLLAYAMFGRKPKVYTLTFKKELSDPSLPPPPAPAPKIEKVPETIEEKINIQKIPLFNGQYAVPYSSQPIANDVVAPLIIVLLPYTLNLQTQHFVWSGLGKNENDPLTNFPKNLPARVFFIAIPNYFSTLDSAGEIGKYVISGLKKLQELYPTNKVIAFGFGGGAGLALYLAGSNAIDSAFIFGDYGHYNYIISNPGITKLIAWATPNAVGKEWYKYNNALYTTYKALEMFTKVNYPQGNFVTGKNEYTWTTGELEEVAKILIEFEPWIYGKDPGFAIEWDGNLNQCAIIIEPKNLGKAVWSITASIVSAARIANQTVTSSDFWGYVNAFYGSINSKCTLQGRYYDDAASAIFAYLAIRSAIRALMTRGLMEPKDADIALNQAKSEALANGAVDKYLPGIKSDFEP